MLTRLVLGSAGRWLAWMGHGSWTTVLAKVAAVLLLTGMLAVAAGLHDLADLFFLSFFLMMPPIMLIGATMWIRALSQTRRRKI